jgi:ABC-type transport system substrate-binding protein
MPGNLMTPSLAESWTVSPDQRVDEFKLREEVTFHNGDLFTAEDVKFSFSSAVGPRVAEPAPMLIDPYPWSAPLEEVRLKPR